jgi:hypothetical protein
MRWLGILIFVLALCVLLWQWSIRPVREPGSVALMLGINQWVYFP